MAHLDDKGRDQMRPGDEAPPGEPAAGENLCPVCGGSGRIDARECRNCAGTGKVTEREDENQVDRDAEETFPASDPPAHY